MKKFAFYLIGLFLIPAFVLTGCKRETEEPNKYEILVDYLKTNAAFDLPAMHSTGWAVSATALNNALADYYIIDLRPAVDFAQGRIQGAVNSTMANLLNEAKNAGSKKIILVCFSGQQAAFAVPALRLSGYPNTFFLKWGMSAWTSQRDVWTAKIGNIAIQPSIHANWSTPPAFTANKDWGKTPKVTSNSDDGATIMKERIAAVLAEGPKFVQPADLLANPQNYFVNNYWTEANVAANGNGHIKGAYRINPMTMTANEFKFLNPDQKIVTYCWTGQTSAAVTFYLRMLGFDAYGLQWGSNALINSQLTSNKWPEGQQNFPLVP